MGKVSQLDRAIQNLKDERAVIDKAIERLEAQRVQQPKLKRPRVVKPEPVAS